MQGLDIENHGPTGIAHVGNVRLPPSQIPDQPTVDGAKGQLPGPGLFARSLDVVQHPANLRPGKISIYDQSGFSLNRIGLPGLFQFTAKIGRSSVLPDDGIADRFSGGTVPNHRGLPLVGNAYTGNIGSSSAYFLERLTSNSQLGTPDFLGVVLDPAGFGKDLLELLLSQGSDGALSVKNDGARTGRPLIES